MPLKDNSQLDFFFEYACSDPFTRTSTNSTDPEVNDQLKPSVVLTDVGLELVTPGEQTQGLTN